MSENDNKEQNEQDKQAEGNNKPEKPELPIDCMQSYVRSFSENEQERRNATGFSSNKTNRVSYRNFSFNATAKEAEQFRAARRMINASIILGIISLFLGGVLISAIGIVFGLMGYFRMKEVSECKSIDDPFTAEAFKRSGLTGLVICIVAFVLNFYSMIVLMPQVMEALGFGDSTNWLESTGLFGSTGSSTTGTTSTWG